MRLSKSFVAASAALLGLPLTAALAAPASAVTLPGQCAPLSVILVPGTGETVPFSVPELPLGMLRPVGETIEGRLGPGVTVRYLPYQASSVPNSPGDYPSSVADGRNRLRSAISTTAAHCPGTTFALGGYSQGAQVAGDIAAEIGQGRGPISADRLVAVTLLADPHRGTAGEELLSFPVADGGSLGPRAEGFGAVSGRVATFCNAGDKWCSAGRVTRSSVTTLYETAFLGTSPTSDTASSSLPSPEAQSDPESARDAAELRRFVATGAADHMTYGNDGVGGSASTSTAGHYIADRAHRG